MRWIIVLYLPVLLLTSAGVSVVRSSPQGMVDATVKISVCGNEIAEDGEDCDADDHRSYGCHHLGFTGGSISCGISCSFDVANCSAPDIDSSSVEPDELDSLLASGLFTIPPTESFLETTSLTVTEPITINISADNLIYLPSDLVITTTEGSSFDPLSLTTQITDHLQVENLPDEATSQVVVQWGVPEVTLQFSLPISITLNLGEENNGLVYTIFRSGNLTSDWTTDGIVSPGTCTVENGSCTFLTTKASFFSVSVPAPTPTPTPTLTPTPTSTPTPTPTPTPTSASRSSTSTSTSNSSSGTTSSSSNSTTTTTAAQPNIITVFIEKIIRLPYLLLQYDSNNNSRIDSTEVYNSVLDWVQNWQHYLQKGELGGCELNYDGLCSLKDLSILLFFVER